MKPILKRDGILRKLAAGESLTGERLARVCITTRAEPTDEEAAKVREKLGGDIVGRIVPFVVSTPQRASDDHTLAPMGCDSEEYERAPHVFWQHEFHGYRASPSRAAARIGVSLLEKSKEAVTALFAGYTREFSEALDGGFSWAITEIAARQGHRASIGFDVVEAAVAPEDVRKTAPWALDISKWRAREWSFVNFGADSDALTEGRLAGVDMEPIARALERFMDELGAETGMAREHLAKLWAAAADPGRARVVALPPVPVVAPVLTAADFARELRSALADLTLT